MIVAEDQEQVDKVVTLRDQLPHLRSVIYDDPRGMSHYRYDWLLSFAEVQELGRRFAPAHPGAFEAAIEQGPAEDGLHLLHLGHDGQPQGRRAHAHQRPRDRRDPRRRGHPRRRRLARLPAHGLGRRRFLHAGPEPLRGLHLQLPGEPGDRAARSPGAGPHGRARAASHLGEHADRGPGPGGRRPRDQAVGVRALPAGRRARGDPPRRRQAGPLGLRLACALGEFLVYGPVRDQLGLRRARWAYTGGAPLGPDTYRFFRSFGVNLKQVYGSTETTGLVSLQPGTEANPTTAGRPCPGVEVRIGDRGEVLVQARGSSRATQERGGHPRGHRPRGLVPHGRRRLPRSARAPRHHRPRQGRGRPRRRHALRAPVHREQAEVQPLHPGGGGLRPRPPLRDGHDRHRPHHGGQLGGAARPSLHELRGPQPEAGDAGPHPGRDPQGQRDAAGRPARCGASCSSPRTSTPTMPR